MPPARIRRETHNILIVDSRLAALALKVPQELGIDLFILNVLGWVLCTDHKFILIQVVANHAEVGLSVFVPARLLHAEAAALRLQLPVRNWWRYLLMVLVMLCHHTFFSLTVLY